MMTSQKGPKVGLLSPQKRNAMLTTGPPYTLATAPYTRTTAPYTWTIELYMRITTPYNIMFFFDKKSKKVIL